MEFTAQYQGEKADVKLPIPGHFSVENALTALGIVLQLGMPLADAGEVHGNCNRRQGPC